MNSVDPTLLDLDSLLSGEWQQLRILLTHTYPASKPTSHTAIDISALIDLLKQNAPSTEQSLVNFIQPQLAEKEILSDESYAVLKFIDQLFDNYEKNCKLHPGITQALKLLRPIAAIQLLNQQPPWQNEQGLMSLLDCIYCNTVGWQPELGRAANRFLLQLTESITKISCDNEADTASIRQFFAQEQLRINKLEGRLRAAELGALHAKHAQQLSAKTLNQKMAGKKLPAAISQFLQGPWRESMRLIIINQGNDSKEWLKIVRLTETLIWTFQPINEDSPEIRQHVLQAIAELSEELHEATIGLHHSGTLDTELSNVENEHLKVLKGQPLDYQPIQLIDNKDPLNNSQVSMSSNLIKQACSYEEGTWFIFNDEGEHKRIKLMANITSAKQFLFTNFIGIKVAQFSFEEFAYRLSSRIITPIPSQNPFKLIAEKILSALFSRHQQQQQQAANDASIEEERKRQENIARQAAQAKALAEAEAIAAAQHAEKIKAEQAAKLSAQLQQLQQHEQATYKQLSQLNIGGVISFINDKGEKENCRLAAVIQSSGDHIFVNREGIKQHVLNKEKLAEKLLKKTASIINLGSNFESTLEQVVNTLRARKNNE